MLPDLICVIISCFAFSLVIAIYFQSMNTMYTIFVKENVIQKTDITSHTSNSFETSVWCYAEGNKTLCTFKNLCYVPKEKVFVFTLTNNSVLHGINSVHDLQNIDLSSVINHNRFAMKLVISPADASVLRRTVVKIKYGFILWRFKWDNIMHVIHDDLLPLYMTYTSLCLGNVTHCATKYKLAFSDEGEYGSLLKWYNIFSNSEPILLHKASKETIICFDESKVGLSATSLWFQYGFGKPQGPIKDSLLNGYHVRQFSEYVLEKFGIPSSPKLRSERSIVFFSRKINRRILNEDEMLKMMQSAYQTTFSSNIIPQIYNLDLATNNTKDILIHLTESETVVGMHGSAMILSMFMRPGSVVVELFPFGINPQHVSPIKAMCKLQDIGLIYRSWVNTKEENTVTYPNAEALLGGISHLPLPEQEQIASLTEIPAVECCHNAAYLFRMFQDTIVDNSLSAVLRGAFLGKKMYSIETFYENTLEHMLSKWYFPAPVTNISCRYSSDNQTITIMWDPPVNTKNPHYNIAVVSNIKQFSTILRKPELTWPVPSVLHDIDKIDVWIKSTEKGKESIDSYFQCNVVI